MTLEALKKRLNLSSDFTKNDLIFQLKSLSSDLGIPYKIIMKHCRAVMIGLEVFTSIYHHIMLYSCQWLKDCVAN